MSLPANQNPTVTTVSYGQTRSSQSNNILPRDRHQSSTDALLIEVLEIDKSYISPMDEIVFPFKDILQTVHNIFKEALGPVAPADAEKALHATMSSHHENQNYLRNELLYDLSCKIFCERGEDKTRTMNILKTVANYHWDVKVVLALEAFAVKDGKYWLRQMQEILKRAGTESKPNIDRCNNLLSGVLNVTECIVELHERYRHPYLTSETKIRKDKIFSKAVYWTIQAIAVAAEQLRITCTVLAPKDAKGKLSSLASELKKQRGNLKEDLDRVHNIIQREEDETALPKIANILETENIDNSKSLKILFYKKVGPALYDCRNKTGVYNGALKGKFVVLFLSDLDLVKENEYKIAQHMHMEKQNNIEIVWVPIVDDWHGAEKQFKQLRSNMNWYTVLEPRVVSPIMIKYIRKQDKWNYNKKPLLVVMDPQGKIVHRNAAHMLCIWGRSVFPFTSEMEMEMERLLWEQETWSIKLLAGAIDQNLLTWITERKCICLYGGEDIEWIRNFTRAARNDALEAGIQLELVYVGKINPKERVMNILDIIQAEKLSHTLEWDLIWFFWIRLETMRQSRGQLLSEQSRTHSPTDPLKSDPIMQWIISMLSFGSSDCGWAVTSLGSADMSNANGEHMLKSLREFKDWINDWKIRSSEVGFTPALNEHLGSADMSKENGELRLIKLEEFEAWKSMSCGVGFTPALNEHLKGVHEQAPHHCISLILPATGIMPPESVECAECGRLMERFTMFRCCTD